MTWVEAKVHCENQGSYLATIETAQEHEYLKRFLKNQWRLVLNGIVLKSSYVIMTENLQLYNDMKFCLTTKIVRTGHGDSTESFLQQQVCNNDTQSGFMPGHGTTGAIFIVHQL